MSRRPQQSSGSGLFTVLGAAALLALLWLAVQYGLVQDLANMLVGQLQGRS